MVVTTWGCAAVNNTKKSSEYALLLWRHAEIKRTIQRSGRASVLQSSTKASGLNALARPIETDWELPVGVPQAVFAGLVSAGSVKCLSQPKP